MRTYVAVLVRSPVRESDGLAFILSGLMAGPSTTEKTPLIFDDFVELNQSSDKLEANAVWYKMGAR